LALVTIGPCAVSHPGEPVGNAQAALGDWTSKPIIYSNNRKSIE